jgi:hypothetical protein
VVYISNSIQSHLGIEIGGIPLHKDEGYWRVHPGHKDIVEVFVDKAYEKLHPHVGHSGHVAHFAVNIKLYGVSKEDR